MDRWIDEKWKVSRYERREVARLFAVGLASRIYRQPSTNQPLPQSTQIEIHIPQTQQYRGLNMGGQLALATINDATANVLANSLLLDFMTIAGKCNASLHGPTDIQQGQN